MIDFVVKSGMVAFCALGLIVILFSDSFVARLFTLLVYTAIGGVIFTAVGIGLGEKRAREDALKEHIAELFKAAKS